MKAPSGLPGVTQCPVLTKGAAAMMKMTMMASLITTMTLLSRADSWIPTTRSAETPAITAMAGTLSSAPVVSQARVVAS